jgi:putative membrane protein
MALLLAGWPALAHDEAEPGAQETWDAWTIEPWVLVPLSIIGLCWLVGLVRLVGRSRAPTVLGSWRTEIFAVGWLTLALVLVSPLHAAGTRSFAAHMAEHEVLMLVAAPLLALSRPSGILLWGLPRGARHVIAGLTHLRWVRGSWRAATDPVAATLAHGAILWLWHMPALFDAAVRDEGVHILQHASFFGSAVLFWWAMFQSREGGRGYGLAVCLFATAVHSGLLGALLVFSVGPWYAVYHGGLGALSPLQDQQLGGLIMWVPAGLVYTAAGLWVFTLWLRPSMPGAAGDAHARAVS